MQIKEIPFGEWLPDAPDYNNPGCLVAEGCYPSSGGYTPFRSGTASGDKLAEAVRGAAQYFRADRTGLIVGGSSTKLLHLYGGTLTATTGYTMIGSDGQWQFEVFNARVIAVAPNNSPQYLTDLESDSTWSNLPGSPPQAKVIGRVGNFLMIGNLSGLSLPTSIQWSAENDPTDWPTPGTLDARLKQSGRATLQIEYGPITGIAGDRYPMIFQERGVSRLELVGPPVVYRVTTIEEARGCIAQGSIVTVGFLTYFLAHDGFHVTDGNQVLPLGTKRINDWFCDEVSEADTHRTHGTVDWAKQCIVWTFYPKANATGFKRQIIYNWVQNRWSTASLSLDWLVDNKADATTVEGLDAVNADLDALTPGLDSQFWTAKSRVLSAFIQDGSSNSEMNLLDGSTVQAAFETGDFQPVPGRRASVNEIYPVVENVSANTQCALKTRSTKGGPTTTTSLVTVNSSEACPLRADGRYVRAQMIIPAAADWNKAWGVRVGFRPSGRR